MACKGYTVARRTSLYLLLLFGLGLVQADEAKLTPDAAPAEEPVIETAVIERDVPTVVAVIEEVEPLNLPEPPEVFLRKTSNHYFEVVGTDYNSVQYVTHMAQEAGEYCSNFVPMSNALPQPILVELVPAERAQFQAPFLIRPQTNGEVIVYLRWDESANFSDTCQALASAYMVRCAIWRFGHSAAGDVPDWLELALGLGLHVHLRPALIDEVVENSMQDEPWLLEDIFSLKGSEGLHSPTARRACLWLVRFLQNQSPSREHFQRLMLGFLSNMPPYELLTASYPQKATDLYSTRLWWAVGYEATIRSRQSPFYSLYDSSKVVRELSSITAEQDGQDIRLALGQLYEFRGNNALRRAAQQRVREIKLELQKINPVYYNALLSLGLTYEAWIKLEAGREDRGEPTPDQMAFAEAFVLYQQDIEAAQLLDLEIKRLLNW